MNIVTVSFRGRAPSPARIAIGRQGDNGVTGLLFETERRGMAFLKLLSEELVAKILLEEREDGYAWTADRASLSHSGICRAQLQIESGTAENLLVWQSNLFTLEIGDSINADQPLEQEQAPYLQQLDLRVAAAAAQAETAGERGARAAIEALRGAKNGICPLDADGLVSASYIPEALMGGAGSVGATFTPSVSEEGVLSWTNNGGLVNPPSVCIQGEDGATFTPAISQSGVLSWQNDAGRENPAAFDFRAQIGFTARAFSLQANGWQEGAQYASWPGLGADSVLIVSPAPDSIDACVNAGVRCVEQAGGQLKFVCDVRPDADLTVYAAAGGALLLAQ